MKTVSYTTCQLISCAKCNGEVIVCVDDDLTTTGMPFVEATIVSTSETWTSCGVLNYVYALSYDENDLVDPTTGLVTSDINGLLCKGCLTDYISAMGAPTTSYILSLFGTYFGPLCFVHSEAELVAAVAGGICHNIVIASDINLTADHTFFSGVTFFNLRNCRFITNGHHLDIHGVFSTPPYQAFVVTASTDVEFSNRTVTQVHPEWWGAIGNGITDDTLAIQSAIDSVVALQRGIVLFKANQAYKVTSTIVVPFTTVSMVLSGYGSKLVGAVDDTILQISDLTSINGHASDVTIEGLTIEGSGEDDVVYDNQNGIAIYSIIGCVLRDVKIMEIPNIGIIGTKPTALNASYWNLVKWDHVQVRFCGRQAVNLGELPYDSSMDDLTLVNCMFNHAGYKIPNNEAAGGVYLRVINLQMSGCEISGIYSATGGYRWGMQLRVAAGCLSGNHFELNGNDQANSADLLLDSDTNGLIISGQTHYGGAATGAKDCIQVLSDGNHISGIEYVGTLVHTYDYCVNAYGATRVHVGSIINSSSPGVGCNILECNVPISFGGSTLVTADDYVQTGRRRERFETRYLNPNPLNIVLDAKWGDAATITAVVACDSHGSIDVNSIGAGQADNATITVNFLDGDWPIEPTVIFYQRNYSVTAAALDSIQVAKSVSGFVVTVHPAPIAGEQYTFDWMCVSL